MDIQAEKLDIIQWLAGIEDSRIIKQFLALKKSNEELVMKELTVAEKFVIDKGLTSIKEGRTKSHEDVMKATKEKYPTLFR
jgi:predicted transcriptional regulator